MTHSKAELRSNGDEVSSCCRLFWTGNASEKHLRVWTLLYGSLKHILLKLTSIWWLRNTESLAFLKSVSSWCAATLHSSFSSGIWSLFGLLCWNQHWWSPVISPHGLIFVRGILNRILYVVGNRSQSRVFGMLWAGQPGIRILVGLWDFSVLQNVQNGSGAHPTSYS